MPWPNMTDEEKLLDEIEAKKNTPFFGTVSRAEVNEHFGIDSDEDYYRRMNNHQWVRDRLMLNNGIMGRKRIIIDFDPDYFCFVWREIPIESAPSQTDQ